jgi:hypothetical protein
LVSLKNILTHILQAHGFEVYEKRDVLFAEKGESLVTVGIFDKLSIVDVKKHAEKMEGVKGMHVLCALGEVSQAVAQSAALEGLVLWKKEDIEAELGKAVVSHLATAEDGLFHQVLKNEPATITLEIQPQPAVSEAGASAEKPDVVIEILGIGQATKVLKPILTLDDAKELSDKTVHGFKYELELLPHYLFQYKCAFDGKGGEQKKSEGIVSVNALTGKHSIWDQKLEFTDEMDPSHVQLEPKLDESTAEKIALDGVIELNTELEELVTERDHATVMEKTVFKPREEDVQLEKLGLVMVPIWCVEGSHGVMLIDAAARKVISEDYYQEKRA